MYPEFIAIYVMLAIAIVLLTVVLIVLLKLLKNGAGKGYPMPQQNAYYGQQYPQQPYQQPYQTQYQQAGGVVFCQHCATQFDASQAYCPQCGTRR